MKITQRHVQDVVILDIDGQIMGGPDSEVFQQTIQSLLTSGKSKIVVNLQSVNWMNSTGLGILISGFSLLDKSGGKMKLLHVSERIASLLEITKLSSIFESYREESAAVRSF
jgi:anti-sigma B factor antagonist